MENKGLEDILTIFKKYFEKFSILAQGGIGLITQVYKISESGISSSNMNFLTGCFYNDSIAYIDTQHYLHFLENGIERKIKVSNRYSKIMLNYSVLVNIW